MDPSLRRHIFICVVKNVVENEEILLVQMEWDGNIDRDPAELVQIGAAADVMNRRCQLAGAIPALTSVPSSQIEVESIEESTLSIFEISYAPLVSTKCSVSSCSSAMLGWHCRHRDLLTGLA